MSEPLPVAALARSGWQDFLRARRVLFIFGTLFALGEIWMLVPAVAIILAGIMAWAGHIAVSNQDILAFVLTPLGLLYAALVATFTVGLVLLEQAGTMVLVHRHSSERLPPIRQALAAIGGTTVRVAQLGAVMAVLLALTLAPFGLLGVLIYRLLLSEHDVYYYLNERPPVFWMAASLGGVLLLAAAAATIWLYVRWALALPILVFERQSVRGALRASRERVRGVAWRAGALLLGWLFGALLAGVVLELGLRLIAAAVLLVAGEFALIPVLLLLVSQAALLATWSFITIIGLGILTHQLYRSRSEPLDGVAPPGAEAAPPPEEPIPPANWWLAWLALPLSLLAPLFLWFELSSYTVPRERVQVTAHRGHARAAPENTLSAIRKAIDSGADYAEVDVQRTADGVPVLLHDRDFKRVAGDSRRLEEMTFAEVRRLDVGSWFDPSFAGERVPTLAEAIELARGRIKLNLELKFFGPDQRLAADVARLVRAKEFEADCLVTSFSYDALREALAVNPRLRTGLIIAHALGDVSRLHLDVLSVRADFLSDELVRSAHRAGRQVHVWGLGDARAMARMIKRGVDNLITADPDLAIRVRDEWDRLTGPERLVLAARLLLGLEP